MRVFTGKEMKNNMSNSYAITPTSLLEKWGFDSTVFNADEARKERRLNSVMEYPEWFLEVLGDVKSLNFIIITGPRGSGKSSIRRTIADHCRSSLGNKILGGVVLCISIDHDSSKWVKNFVLNSNKPSVDFFCEEIVDQLIVAVLTYGEIDKLKDKLEKKEIYFLERHIYRLQETRPDDVSSIADKLLSKYKKLKSNEAVKDWLSIITSLFGNQVSLENRSIETPAIDDLPIIIQIVKKCGFDAIYVLIDEIDEYDETNGKPDFAAEIIVPILSSINLLEKDSIGLKFFLSAPVYQRLDEASKTMNMEIRYDRTLQPDPYILEWTDSNISKMLKKRLMTYSNNNLNSLNQFCDDEIKDIDSLIVKYAYKNPRHMIQLCDRIVRYTARSAYITNFCITKNVLNKALVDFSKRIVKTYVGADDYLTAVINDKMLSFVDKDFADNNGIDINEARKGLDKLVLLGALTSKAKLNGEKKYTVCDPRIVYLIEEGIEIQ